MTFTDNYFSVQVFFIVLRETIESAIIISVLLACVSKSLAETKDKAPQGAAAAQDSEAKRKESRRLKVQIWAGGLCGFLACLVVGAVILAVFYVAGSDLWAVTEHYWEGMFSVVASVIISVMGIKILRVNKMQEKWSVKMRAAVRQYDVASPAARQSWGDRNAMFVLPFVTTLREGLEAVVFVGGIGINDNTSKWSIINAALLAMAIGASVGLVLYRSGHTLSLQVFLVASTSFLYLVAAGLFSKGIWNFELQSFIDRCGGADVSESGHGPGSYDIMRSVWHVNCCNGEMAEDGVFWMLFTAVFGWTNSATYGSVLGYVAYWATIIGMFMSLAFEEKHGYLPGIPLRLQSRRIKKREYLRVQQADGQRTSVDSTTPLRG